MLKLYFVCFDIFNYFYFLNYNIITPLPLPKPSYIFHFVSYEFLTAFTLIFIIYVSKYVYICKYINTICYIYVMLFAHVCFWAENNKYGYIVNFFNIIPSGWRIRRHTVLRELTKVAMDPPPGYKIYNIHLQIDLDNSLSFKFEVFLLIIMLK